MQINETSGLPLAQSHSGTLLFNSFHFLCFFPVVLLAYFVTPHKWRWTVLLAASYYFYGSWNWWYLGLIMLSTAVDFVAAQKIGAAADDAVRRRFLWLSIVSNLGILFSFKYFNFFVDSAQAGLSKLGVAVPDVYLSVLLPVGISFYTFQTMSYTIDVYKGRIEPEKHPGYFALFVAFWPQLVAGPIERASRLLPQIRKTPATTPDDVLRGINRIAYGFFKKVVIADRLALYVDPVFADPEAANAVQISLAAFFFLLQVYCDFSGYSDIAVGAARIMGFDLVINFNRPFLATSFRDYWRRWHISLTNWVRDYIYIPLGGNRVSSSRYAFNVFFAFALMGLWHGANWTFVIWGVLHAFFLAAEHFVAPAARVLPSLMTKISGWALVILGFSISMVFFRSESLSNALTAFGQLGDWAGAISIKGLRGAVTWNEFLIQWVLLCVLALSYLLPSNFRLRYPLLYLVVTATIILIFGVDEKISFIYFQF